MKSSKISQHPLGFMEIEDKPSKEQLREYYTEQYFQSNQSTYRSAYSEAEYIFINNKIEQRAQLVNKLRNGRLGTMLDVGCGEGFVMSYFKKNGWEVAGLDYSRAGLSSMNPHCLPMLTVGDIEILLNELVDAKRKFDLIWLGNVLEHVLDPVALMCQMRELVNINGVLVVTVPNDFSFVQRRALELGHVSSEFWVKTPDHLSYFDASSLSKLGAATGYKCQHMLADFPIDWYLFHEGSNYWANSAIGAPIHHARVELENLIAERPTHLVNRFYESMADLGFGRGLTAFFTSRVEPADAYVCMGRHVRTYQGYSIRSVQPDDIESIRQWRNSQMSILRQQHLVSATEQVKYYEENIWPTLTEPQPKNILLAYLLNDKLIGYGGLVHIDWECFRAEVSFLLNPLRTCNAISYAFDFSVFLRLIKTIAFKDLKLHKLHGETYANRTTHINVLESAGFELEGRMRQHVSVDGTLVDSLIHGCLSRCHTQ